ncbi:hypothetical protein [Jannaschia formosa]|uniref:hypothetical protein n=1 Tax=Jannaschia formosa TaxID=2259592 RepID=UPI00107539C2|nr:hypothetical protein [Jannaschia formosa]TFL16137.1 hypothetical protein DR046_21685 [Jannaschia formosa]
MQIKTTTHPGPDGRYRWQISCGYRGSPRGRRPYPTHSFALLACVVLPAHGVYFVPAGPPRIALHPRDLPGLLRDPLASLHEALATLDLDALAPTP